MGLNPGSASTPCRVPWAGPFPTWLQCPRVHEGFGSEQTGSLLALSLGPHQKVALPRDPQFFQNPSYWSQTWWSFLLYRGPSMVFPQRKGAASKPVAQVSLPCLPWCPCLGVVLWAAPAPFASFLSWACSLSLTNSSPATPALQRNSSLLFSGRERGRRGARHIWGPWELRALWSSYSAVEMWSGRAGLREGMSLH